MPVQVFAINESIFQLNMFWPIFLGLLVPLDRARWMAMACSRFSNSRTRKGSCCSAGRGGIVGVASRATFSGARIDCQRRGAGLFRKGDSFS
jgi:hypothetical protein